MSHPEIYPSDPELINPSRSSDLEASIHGLLPNIPQILNDHGFPPELWSSIPDPKVVARSLVISGYLPNYLPLTIQIDSTPIPLIEKRTLCPEGLNESIRMLGFRKEGWFCFTRGEDWWQGPSAFLVNNLSSAAMATHYRLASTTLPALQNWNPLKSPGRPTKENPDGFSSIPGLYNQWKEYCRERNEALALHEKEWKEAFLHCEALRLNLTKERERTMINWDQYKSKHSSDGSSLTPNTRA